MGNQSSNNSSSSTTTGTTASKSPNRTNSGNRSEKLLRRNKRTAYHGNNQQQQQIIPSFVGGNGSGMFPCSEPRTSRSRSLEPQCAEAVKVIEHSQSARYPRNRRIRQKNNYLSPESAANLPSNESNKVEEVEEEITICNTGLTQHQKLILQKIWMIAGPREIIECGKSIVSHLLRTNSTLFSIFHLPQCPEPELITLPAFLRQAANFAMVFDFVMTNLIDDLEKVCFALESLGRHHTELGFIIEASMWSLFQRVIEDNPPKAVHQNAHGHPTWKLMVSFLIRQMRVGYNKAFEEQHQQQKEIQKFNPS